jgi:predicted component of type VI protein secretion system
MAQAENPTLVVRDGPQAGLRVTLTGEMIVVGRDATCDMVLAERQVSRQHIQIKRAGENFRVVDLDSKNGTWLNGKALKGDASLQNGDQIDLAQVVRLVFVASEATEPIAPDVMGAATRLHLDRDARRVFIGPHEVDPPLSLPQYRLLELLVDAKGAVCTRDQVVRAVWPDAISEGVSEQAIDALVRRLRDRITEIDPEHQYIITVRGHGFRLDLG